MDTEELESTLVVIQVPDQMDLTHFVEKARLALDNMSETFLEETGIVPEEQRSLDAWLEDFESFVFNA